MSLPELNISELLPIVKANSRKVLQIAMEKKPNLDITKENLTEDDLAVKTIVDMSSLILKMAKEWQAKFEEQRELQNQYFDKINILTDQVASYEDQIEGMSERIARMTADFNSIEEEADHMKSNLEKINKIENKLEKINLDKIIDKLVKIDLDKISDNVSTCSKMALANYGGALAKIKPPVRNSLKKGSGMSQYKMG